MSENKFTKGMVINYQRGVRSLEVTPPQDLK